MANFEKALAITLHAEGGYANNPNDHGGETYKGVARKFNPNWGGWKIIDAVKATHPPSLNSVLGANPELQSMISMFYQTNYWDVNQTSQLKDQQLANQVFDMAVNSGTVTAAKMLQEAAGVTADGKIGPITIAAVNDANPLNIYNSFLAHRKGFYERIIARDSSQKRFEASWFSRLTPYTTSTIA